jgi:hypothetical protein
MEGNSLYFPKCAIKIKNKINKIRYKTLFFHEHGGNDNCKYVQNVTIQYKKENTVEFEYQVHAR